MLRNNLRCPSRGPRIGRSDSPFALVRGAGAVWNRVKGGLAE